MQMERVRCRTGSIQRIHCLCRLHRMTAILLLVLFGMAAGCSKGPQEKAQPKSAEVTVIKVEAKDVPVYAEYVAQTQSSRLVNIQARVSGFLDKRVYTEGSIVKEGDTLFLMDQKPFKAQLDQVEAALARQNAAMTTAKANLERVKPLAEMDALSQKDLDDAVGQYQSYAAAVDQAKAQVETAKLNLSYTIITSPVAGITSFAQQADGTYISQQNSLLTTVAVLSPMWVNFSISENEWQRFHEEERKGLLRMPKGNNFVVEVILVDGSLFPYTGRITFADSSFNPQTGTFLLRASVDNPKGTLMPNQYVRARIKGAIRPNAILVPQRAIQQGSKGHFVWVVDKDGKAEARPVTVGSWSGDEWFVFEGLKAGERVVTDGALLLSPGMPVTIKQASTAPGPAPGAEPKQPPAAAGEKKSSP
ncbi:MAG TPA: efflux RND transporter periplasmic adaptor subunit [Syntrophales bacterium]|nr:efflux RND transporter periplasmic adaptor subunit [Syntrophales bacterium]